MAKPVKTKAGKTEPAKAKPVRKRALRPDHPEAGVRRGPRSAAGRKRVAQNARRHGLSVPAFPDAGVAAEIEALARRICGPGDATAADASDAASRLAADALAPDALHLARRIAEAQFDVKRVRLARHRLMASRLANPRYRTRKGLRSRIAMLGRVVDMLLRGIPIPPDIAHAVHHRPQGADKEAEILADYSVELAAMDRYERRALSRRKSAIRAFDDALDKAAARTRAARASARRHRAGDSDGHFGKTISSEKPNEIKEARSEAAGPRSGTSPAVPEPSRRPGAISPCGINPAKQFPAINPTISREIDLAGGGRHIRGECSAQAAHAATPPPAPGGCHDKRL